MWEQVYVEKYTNKVVISPQSGILFINKKK